MVQGQDYKINSMRKLAYTVSVLFLAISISYIFWGDYLPSRTPLKIARIISGIPIPGNVEIVHFSHGSSEFTGDFNTEIIIGLSDDQLNNLLKEISNENYNDLPISKISGGFLFDQVGKTNEGKYIEYSQNGLTSYVVLDITKKQLVVFSYQV